MCGLKTGVVFMGELKSKISINIQGSVLGNRVCFSSTALTVREIRQGSPAYLDAL